MTSKTNCYVRVRKSRVPNVFVSGLRTLDIRARQSSESDCRRILPRVRYERLNASETTKSISRISGRNSVRKKTEQTKTSWRSAHNRARRQTDQTELCVELQSILLAGALEYTSNDGRHQFFFMFLDFLGLRTFAPRASGGRVGVSLAPRNRLKNDKFERL